MNGVESGSERLRADALDGLYALGHSLLEETDGERAMHVFRTMLWVGPHDERSWVGLSEAHRLKGEVPVAVSILTLGVATLASSVRCAVGLGRLLAGTGDDVGAARAYEEAQRRAELSGDEELVALAGFGGGHE